MVQICKEEGVWSVVDAAHSIGQEMDINLGEVQPDFFLSVCSKRTSQFLSLPYGGNLLELS